MARISTKQAISAQNSATPLGVADPNSAVELEMREGLNTLAIQTRGTYTGALSLQVSIDGINWATVSTPIIKNVATGVMSSTIPSAAQAVYSVNVAAMQKVRITALGAITGSVDVSMTVTDAVDELGLSVIDLLPGVDYDYLDVQQTDSDTETYVFKIGGSGGTTVRTIIINYTDSTKEDIDNVSWA